MKRLIVAVAALVGLSVSAMAQPSALPPLSLPASPVVVFLGDSITANEKFQTTNVIGGVTTNVLRSHMNGYPFWVRALTNGRINSQLLYNLAVSGWTSKQILENQVPQAIALNPDICIVMAGRNDNGAALPDTTPGTISYNLKQIYNKLQAANCIVIGVKILSQPFATWPSQALERNVLLANNWIEQQKFFRKGFYLVDNGNTYDDQTSLVHWQPKAHYVSDFDNTHPSVWGAYVVGKTIAAQINQLYPDWHLRLQNVDDVYDAVNNPGGDNLPNQMFAGTGGLASAGATGTVATGWALNGGASATVVGSKTTTADGRQQQTVTISGTATGTNGQAILFANLPNANFTTGDQISCSVDVSWGQTTNIIAVSMLLASTEGGVNYIWGSGFPGAQGLSSDAGYMLPTDVAAGAPATSISIPIYSPLHTFTDTPASGGSASLFRMYLQIQFFSPAAATPVAGTFNFASPSCRKVITTTP